MVLLFLIYFSVTKSLMYCHFQGFLITPFLQLIDSIFHYDFQSRLKQKLFFQKSFFHSVSYFPYFVLSFLVLPLLFVCPNGAQSLCIYFGIAPFVLYLIQELAFVKRCAVCKYSLVICVSFLTLISLPFQVGVPAKRPHYYKFLQLDCAWFMTTSPSSKLP